MVLRRRILERLSRRAGWPRPRVACLLFHRVTKSDAGAAGLYPRTAVSLELFTRLVAHVAEHFVPISIGELVAGLSRNDLPADGIVVTFDDGFADGLTHALPVLERFQVPAVVYLTTGFVDRTEVPFEYDLARLVASRSSLRFAWQGVETSWNFRTREDRRSCYRDLRQLIKRLPPEERRSAVEQLLGSGAAGRDRPDPYLTWGQAREMARSPLISIGSHTHAHSALTSLPRGEVHADILRANERIQETLGVEVRHFAYPYGACNAEVRGCVRELRFESAVTTEPWGCVEWVTDPLRIPRLEVVDDAALRHRTVPALVDACLSALRGARGDSRRIADSKVRAAIPSGKPANVMAGGRPHAAPTGKRPV